VNKCLKIYVLLYVYIYLCLGGVKCVERRYPLYLVALYVPLAIQGAIFHVLCKLRWLKTPPAPAQQPVRLFVLPPLFAMFLTLSPTEPTETLLTYVTLYFYDFLQAHLIFA